VIIAAPISILDRFINALPTNPIPHRYPRC
jgi:hypothetical protein